MQGFIMTKGYEMIGERGRGKVRLDSVGLLRIRKETKIGKLNVYGLSIILLVIHTSTHTRD
jgi:hypothetical protein